MAMTARPMPCPDDEALAQFVEHQLAAEQHRELRLHIRSCDSCRELVVNQLQVLHDADTSPTVRLPTPTQAGRYRLGDVLGYGAMGVVYVGFDPELGRRLAVKLLRPRTTAEGRVANQRERFLLESRNLARVVHPNVVAIHDVGNEGDQIFIAMELVEGGTLRDWLRTGEHALAETLALGIAIGQGLAAVHKAGLIHRDFKPENVLLGGDGRPRVTDFGLARLDLDDDVEVTGEGPTGQVVLSLTQSGDLVGTPRYMAPEQLRGEAVDARADIFAFGLVLWEMVFGTRAYEGDSVLQLEGNARERRYAETERTQARATLPLRRVLERGLAPDPASRFSTVDEMIAQLVLLSQPPLRSGRRLAMLLGVLLAGSASVGLGLWQLAERRRCRTVAPSAWRASLRSQLTTHLARSSVPAAAAVSAQLVALLDRYAARIDETRQSTCEVGHERTATGARLYEAKLECLQRRQAYFELLVKRMIDEPPQLVSATDRVTRFADPAECAAIQDAVPIAPGDRDRREQVIQAMTRAEVELVAPNLQVAERQYAAAQEQAEAIGDQPLVAEALLGRAQAVMFQDRKEEARRLVDQAIATALSVSAKSVALKGYAIGISIAAMLQRPSKELEREADQFKWLAARAGHDGKYQARVLRSLALAYANEGKHNEAEAQLKRGLADPTIDVDRRAELGLNLGYALLNRGALEEGGQVLDRALIDAVASYGPDSQVALEIEQARVFRDYSAGGARAALPGQERIVARVERFGAELTSLLVGALDNQVEYLLALKEPRRALEVAARARTIAEAKLAADDPARAVALTQHAACLLDLDRADDALPILEQVRDRLRAGNRGADPSPSLETAMLDLGLARAVRLKDPARARVHLLRARQGVAGHESRADIKAMIADIEALEQKLPRGR